MKKFTKFLLTAGILTASAYIGYKIYKYLEEKDMEMYDDFPEDDFDDDFFVDPKNNPHKIIIGQSGSGKTRNYVETFYKEHYKQNLIIVDPNGNLYKKYGKKAQDDGCSVDYYDTKAIIDAGFDLNTVLDAKTANFGEWKQIFIEVPSEFENNTNVFIEGVFKQLQTYKEKHPEYNKHFDFIIDDFPNISKINDFSHMITIARKYNITFHIIAQSLTQIYDYFDDRTEYMQTMANFSYIYVMGNMLDEKCKELLKLFISEKRYDSIITAIETIPANAFIRINNLTDIGYYRAEKIDPDTIKI